MIGTLCFFVAQVCFDQSAGLSPVWPWRLTVQCRERGSRVVGRSRLAANEEFGLGGGGEMAVGHGGTL